MLEREPNPYEANFVQYSTELAEGLNPLEFSQRNSERESGNNDHDDNNGGNQHNQPAALAQNTAEHLMEEARSEHLARFIHHNAYLDDDPQPVPELYLPHGLQHRNQHSEEDPPADLNFNNTAMAQSAAHYHAALAQHYRAGLYAAPQPQPHPNNMNYLNLVEYNARDSHPPTLFEPIDLDEVAEPHIIEPFITESGTVNTFPADHFAASIFANPALSAPLAVAPFGALPLADDFDAVEHFAVADYFAVPEHSPQLGDQYLGGQLFAVAFPLHQLAVQHVAVEQYIADAYDVQYLPVQPLDAFPAAGYPFLPLTGNAYSSAWAAAPDFFPEYVSAFTPEYVGDPKAEAALEVVPVYDAMVSAAASAALAAPAHNFGFVHGLPLGARLPFAQVSAVPAPALGPTSATFIAEGNVWTTRIVPPLQYDTLDVSVNYAPATSMATATATASATATAISSAMAAAIAIPTDTVPEADAQSPTLTTASSAAVITPEVPVANLPKTTTPKKRRNSNSQSRHPAGKIISQAGRLALIAYLLKVAFDAAHDNAEQAARTTGLTVEQVQWHINNNVHSVRSRLIGYLKSLVRGHTRTRKPQNKPQNKNNTDPKTEDEEAPKNNPARQ